MAKAVLCSICEKVIGGNGFPFAGFPFANLRGCCSWECWLEHANRWCYVLDSKSRGPNPRSRYPNPKYYDKRGHRLPGMDAEPNGVY